MSGVGFWELVLVFLIGLIVLGPERLPRVANQLGTWLGQARRMTRNMRRQLEEELNLEQDPTIRRRPDALPPPWTKSRAEENDDRHSPAHDVGTAGAENTDADAKKPDAGAEQTGDAGTDREADTAPEEAHPQPSSDSRRPEKTT